jgi:hypothetical protein
MVCVDLHLKEDQLMSALRVALSDESFSLLDSVPTFHLSRDRYEVDAIDSLCDTLTEIGIIYYNNKVREIENERKKRMKIR